MLFKEIIAVYHENHTKPINTLCGQNAELLNVKSGGRVRIVTTVLRRVKHALYDNRLHPAWRLYRRNNLGS
jgi:hypothetical protein